MNSPYHSSSATTKLPARSFSCQTVATNSTNIPLSKVSSKMQQRQLNEANHYMNYDTQKEPIKAYLRMRPKPENYEEIEEPYVEIMNDIEVSMTPPKNSNAYRTRHRVPEKYRFTKVFQPQTDQQTFFNETTLDLVQDVLLGHNSLIFAYGVTNSGKTHSIMGKTDDNKQAGLIPRALNVIFNSVKGYCSETKIKPFMHSLIQTYEDIDEENRNSLNLCNSTENQQAPLDTTESVTVDTNFEHGIWVSFVEVYNEQIFDLLDENTKSGTGRTALHLKYEQKSGNKYVADMNMVKVKSAEEAVAIMKFGQRNRQVFSTLMNQASSRSHSIFTIYVVKCPTDKYNFAIEDPNFTTVSKLSIVDLAGSERYKNTNSTGQRLKEAGNINKSLMALGQCMEALRSNQIKIDMGKTPAMVPFRHSKLTELFKSTFEGDGKAVIIVNVNPYDTGFDENNHVMRFAAVAKDVTMWRQIKPTLDLQRLQPNTKRLQGEANTDSILDYEEDRYDNENDHFVDTLIFELNDLKKKWMVAEARAANIEPKVRQEFDEKLQKMEQQYLLAFEKKKEAIEVDKNLDDTIGNPFLASVLLRQQSLIVEIDSLKMCIKDLVSSKEGLLEKIAELEKTTQQKDQNLESLQSDMHNLESFESTEPSETSHSHEGGANYRDDEDDNDQMKENDNPSTNDSFNNFLNLRKQLRRSIFKRDELCKDADAIMKQVEQFDDVTFELAKETQMGKLLKLIAQEEFEKDPYHIRNRAVRLFKRYAQLPNSSPNLSTDSLKIADQSLPIPRRPLSSMSIESDLKMDIDHDDSQESTDIETVRSENARLKHKIETLNRGQKRLKVAFEQARVLHKDHIPETIGISTNIKSMKLDEEEINELNAQLPRPMTPLESEINVERLSNVYTNLQSSQTSTELSYTTTLTIEDDYESDISELLRHQQRNKRRRKLRTR